LTIYVPEKNKLVQRIAGLGRDYDGNKKYVAQRLTEISGSLGDLRKKVDALEKSLPKVEIKHFEDRCTEYIEKVRELDRQIGHIEKDVSTRLDQLSQSVSPLLQSTISKEKIEKIIGDYESVSQELRAVNVNIHKLVRTMMLLCDGDAERVRQTREQFRALKVEVEKKLGPES